MNSRSLAILGAIGLMAACAEDQTAPRSVTAPAAAEYNIQPMNCAVQVQARTVSCTPATGGGEPLANRIRKDLIVGGQHTYVTLTSSNIVNDPNFDPGIAGRFQFDVTLTNLTPQPFGTSDGTTADTAGIKVFLTSQPVTTGGTGTVTVENPSGTGTFTNTNQPFYQYAGSIGGGILDSGQTTSAVNWVFSYDPTVTTFAFTAYVATPVPHPNGYIKGGMPPDLWLDPGELFVISPTAYSVVGNVITDTLLYQSEDATVATATSDGTITAGSVDSSITLTVSDVSGTRPGLDTAVVEVCPSTVVTDGTVLSESIAPTDCRHPLNNIQPFDTYRADIYRVALTAGQTITVTMDPNPGLLDTYLVLSDRIGNVVATNDDALGALGAGSQIVYTATATGTYIIQATTYQPSATGNYTLSVSIL